jgi:hypothetical protein
MSFSGKWKELETFILSEVSQAQRPISALYELSDLRYFENGLQ